MTVREMVSEVQRELLAGNVTPERGAALDNRLSALLGNCLEEIRDADAEFNLVLLGCLKAEKAANRAKVLAETMPQYARRREARDTETLILEMIRSLRHHGRIAQEEMRLQR